MTLKPALNYEDQINKLKVDHNLGYFDYKFMGFPPNWKDIL